MMMGSRSRERHAGLVAFVLIAVLGLFTVKWAPYWHKGFVVAAGHSIGPSILTGGTADLPPSPSFAAAADYAWAYGKAVWRAVVLGLLLGSAVQALLPQTVIVRWLGRAGAGSVLRGTALGLPGMMCTCCAALITVGLRRARASAGASVAFWLSNSLLNPATLVFIGFVLGWRWSAMRLVLGLVVVVGLGLATDRLASPDEAEAAERHLAGSTDPQPDGGPFARWIVILGQMSVRLVPEYLVLVLLMGAARAWLFPGVGPEIGNGLGWIIGFAVAGALFVIPTAGEVPIIQAMLALGAGSGPAAALLLALPPISVPSVAMVWSVFRPRVLALLLAGVVASGGVAGLAAAGLRF